MKTHVILFLSLILFLGACVSFDKADLENLSGDVRVIGHAGSGFASWIPFNPYPSNSLTSIIKAIDEGADGIEVDVHMTADKKFVLYHDNMLESKSSHSGCPADMNLEDLEQIHYQLGAPFDWFHSEKIISLEKVIELCKQKGSNLEIHLDLRSISDCHDDEWDKMWGYIMIRKLKRALKKWDYPAEKIYLITYSKKMVWEFKKLKLPYNLSYELSGDILEGLEWAKKRKLRSITIKPSLLTKDIVDFIHSNNMELITFGAKSKSGSKDLLELNPDVIQSNNVSALKELLED